MILTRFDDFLDSVNKFYKIMSVDDVEDSLFYTTGLKTNLQDIYTIDDYLVTLLKDGTIKKTMLYQADLLQSDIEQNGYPNVHILECGDVQHYKENKNSPASFRKTLALRKALKLDREFYIVVKEGKDDEKSKKEYNKLQICDKCLKMYSEKYKKKQTNSTFSPQEYLDKPLSNAKFYGSDFMYADEDLETVPRCYHKSWTDISKRLKAVKHYVCERCAINLSEHKEFLHTHHERSSLVDPIITQLEVLCIKCHSLKPDHSHIEPTRELANFLKYKKELNQ